MGAGDVSNVAHPPRDNVYTGPGAPPPSLGGGGHERARNLDCSVPPRMTMRDGTELIEHGEFGGLRAVQL